MKMSILASFSLHVRNTYEPFNYTSQTLTHNHSIVPVVVNGAAATRRYIGFHPRILSAYSHSRGVCSQSATAAAPRAKFYRFKCNEK